jgi:hypothetical protein
MGRYVSSNIFRVGIPGAVKIIGHEVEPVDILRDCFDIEVLKVPSCIRTHLDSFS